MKQKRENGVVYQNFCTSNDIVFYAYGKIDYLTRYAVFIPERRI